jgi:tRNA(fMet)-specific endonuclease VapC
VSGSIHEIGRYLLDTNVAVAILNDKVDLEQYLGVGRDAFLSTTVLGELCFGAEKSSRIEDNFIKIRRLANLCPVLVCDEETARQYGLIKKLLEQRGKPIPENDIWIAASARQHGLTLVTRDGHFGSVEDLIVERW